MPAYGDGADYWDARYAAEPTAFEWYLSYDGVAPVLQQTIAPPARILQLGCGTSLLGAQMVEQGGYAGPIVSIDVSSVAVSQMQALHARLAPQLQYSVGDARSMPQFADGSFDALLDKGTLDTLICSPDALASVTQTLHECARVLRHDGVMLSITYGEPASRVPLFQRSGWAVEFFIVTKQQQPAAGAPAGSAAGTCVVEGPLDAAAQASLEAFSSLTGVYFVYVLRKQQPQEAAGHAAGTGVEQPS